MSSDLLMGYVKTIYKPEKWNADMILLPKSVTPEIALQSFIEGKPASLMPINLFKTLRSQSPNDLKLLAVIPYKNKNGKATIATFGDDKIFFEENKAHSALQSFDFTDYNLEKPQFFPREWYSTEEWKDDVILGILVKGSKEELDHLKILIDRKTVAQAFYLLPGATSAEEKFIKLQTAIHVLSFIIIFSTIAGLFINYSRLRQERNKIFLVLRELKSEKKFIILYGLTQIIFLVLVPILIGVSTALCTFDIVKQTLPI